MPPRYIMHSLHSPPKPSTSHQTHRYNGHRSAAFTGHHHRSYSAGGVFSFLNLQKGLEYFRYARQFWKFTFLPFWKSLQLKKLMILVSKCSYWRSLSFYANFRRLKINIEKNNIFYNKFSGDYDEDYHPPSHKYGNPHQRHRSTNGLSEPSSSNDSNPGSGRRRKKAKEPGQ